MKKMISYASHIMISATLITAAYAQVTPVPQAAAMQQPMQRPLTDQTMNQTLNDDFKTRNSSMANQPVNWYDSGNGYYGTYSNQNQDYMTHYDKKGQYVETMSKKAWNDQVPSNVRSSFDQSPYKSQQVTSYWEVSDPGKKGYYMEVKDSNGKTSKVWADENGTISDKPSMSKPH